MSDNPFGNPFGDDGEIAVGGGQGETVSDAGTDEFAAPFGGGDAGGKPAGGGAATKAPVKKAPAKAKAPAGKAPGKAPAKKAPAKGQAQAGQKVVRKKKRRVEEEEEDEALTRPEMAMPWVIGIVVVFFTGLICAGLAFVMNKPPSEGMVKINFVLNDNEQVETIRFNDKVMKLDDFDKKQLIKFDKYYELFVVDKKGDEFMADFKVMPAQRHAGVELHFNQLGLREDTDGPISIDVVVNDKDQIDTILFDGNKLTLESFYTKRTLEFGKKYSVVITDKKGTKHSEDFVASAGMVDSGVQVKFNNLGEEVTPPVVPGGNPTAPRVRLESWPTKKIDVAAKNGEGKSYGFNTEYAKENNDIFLVFDTPPAGEFTLNVKTNGHKEQVYKLDFEGKKMINIVPDLVPDASVVIGDPGTKPTDPPTEPGDKELKVEFTCDVPGVKVSLPAYRDVEIKQEGNKFSFTIPNATTDVLAVHFSAPGYRFKAKRYPIKPGQNILHRFGAVVLDKSKAGSGVIERT